MNFNLLLYLSVFFFFARCSAGLSSAMLQRYLICKNDICLKDENHSTKILNNKLDNNILENNLNNVNISHNNKESVHQNITDITENLNHNVLGTNLKGNLKTDMKNYKTIESVNKSLQEKSENSATMQNMKINEDELYKNSNIEYVKIGNHYMEKLENISELVSSNFESSTEVNPEHSTESEKSFNNIKQVAVQDKPKSYDTKLLFNFTNHNDICFCDLSVNACDINCCCDIDCNSLHWNIFLKCNDMQEEYESNYCYKHEILFENNIHYKVIQTRGGLFCIIKNNLKSKEKYKTKEIVKNLESFNKSLPKHFYAYNFKNKLNQEYNTKNYHVGSLIWTLWNKEFLPFGIPDQTVGVICSEVFIKYLKNQVAMCYQNNNECGNSKSNMFYYLENLKIISNPNLINASQKFDLEKMCQRKGCIGVDFHICQDSSDCTPVLKKGSIYTSFGCSYSILKIQYQIWHNGSDGIKKFEAFIWLRNVSKESDKLHLQTIEVNFLWIGQKKVFERSGNPGYITGKPVMAGRKVIVNNGTSEKKEHIEVSFDTNNWLSILGSYEGLCSSYKRTPINFRENGHFSCELKLSKNNFSASNCIELQSNIFKLLLGEELINLTSDFHYNKFVASYGNSRVDNVEDWVQVLLDMFPIITSQVHFKFGYNKIMCKNIISELIINVIYSNTGSFIYPQAKILGVSFHFGRHKDFFFYCKNSDCERTTHYQYYKLSSMVHFIDITEPASAAFAEPLGLEIKLPHDFFYPFFSGSSKFPLNFKFILFCFFLMLLKIIA